MNDTCETNSRLRVEPFIHELLKRLSHNPKQIFTKQTFSWVLEINVYIVNTLA